MTPGELHLETAKAKSREQRLTSNYEGTSNSSRMTKSTHHDQKEITNLNPSVKMKSETSVDLVRQLTELSIVSNSFNSTVEIMRSPKLSTLGTARTSMDRLITCPRCIMYSVPHKPTNCYQCLAWNTRRMNKTYQYLKSSVDSADLVNPASTPHQSPIPPEDKFDDGMTDDIKKNIHKFVIVLPTTE